ncbi:MAG: glycoside hydrolase family 20 zincin-like fold domain-containing protein [Candidatus Peribacteraceae bacterium]|jgi:hypothetical protein
MKQTKIFLIVLLYIAVFAAVAAGVERGWMGWKGILRAQLWDNGENLLRNGGMEGECAVLSDGDAMPPSWERYGTIGGRTCDTTEKHGGEASWKITSSGTQYGLSEQIPVTPGTWYKGGAWVKGLRGNEYTMINLWEYDANMQRIRTPSFPLYLFAPTEWTSAAAMLRTSSGTSFVRVLLTANYRTGGVTWFDDVSLVRLPDGPNAVFLPTGPLDGADAKSIDFGMDTVMSESTSYTADVLGPGASTGSTSFRSLLPTKRLEVRFPAFNVDGEGLPQTPLLLEVRYRDTIDEALSTSATNHRATVGKRVDFIPDDPLVANGNAWVAVPFGLGRNGDGVWRVEQTVFSASPFSLLRARDGMFSFSISMPNLIPADASLQLPLDYITLRAITPEEHEFFLKESRERLGFYEVPLPPDRSGDTFTEPYVVFKRDEMAMVYRHTQPSKNEVVDALSAFSAPGEIEPLSFGLYAQETVANLAFTITDLRREDGTAIPSSALSLRRVTYDVKQAREYPRRGSALMPDRLEPFTSLTLPAGTTTLLWMHVHVPPDAAPGTYRGEVRVSDGRTLPLRFTVLPLALDRSSAINAVYHDPYLKPISWNTGEAFRFYREYGLDPFFYDMSITPLKDAQGAVTGFDTTKLEQRLDRMVAEGFLKDRAVFQPYNWASIYKALYGRGLDLSTPTLWEELSRPEFVAAFGAYIRKVIELGEARGVQWHFSVSDEPGINPQLRIISDRLYTIIRAYGGKTTVTSYPPIGRALSGSLLGVYQVPGGVVPSLFPLLDVPVLAMRYTEYGSQIQGGKGYYTTYFSNVRYPVYNRFLHGFGAFGFDASIISSYAMSDSVADPFNDFDVNPLREFTLYPDFILAYPTWSGELLPLLAAEGIREGIKDAKYIATLQRLLQEHPEHPAASVASALLEGMRARITTDPSSHTSAIRQDGYYEEVFKDVSPAQDPGDFRAFTTVRRQLAASILRLRGDRWLTEKVPVPPTTSSTTPSYTFHSAFDGSITYGGSCTSATVRAVSGDNTVTFSALAPGAHGDCTVTVTDDEGLATDTLAVSGFTVGDGQGGEGAETIAAAVIPRPQQVQKLSGLTVDVTTDWTIAADLDDPFEAFTVQELRKELWGKGSAVPASAYPAVDVSSQPSGARIIIGNPKENAAVGAAAAAAGINIDTALTSDAFNEGYVLLARPKEILILAKSTAGTYYGMVTLSWLLNLSPEKGSGSTLTLPHTKITDWPDLKIRAFYGGGIFSWKGETINTSTVSGGERWLTILTRYKYNLWMDSLPRLSQNPTAAAVQKLLEREDFLRKRHMYTALTATPYSVRSFDETLHEGIWMRDVPATVREDGGIHTLYEDIALENPGFEEDADGNGVPDNWLSYPSNNDPASSWTLDTKDSHAGGSSIKLAQIQDLSGTTKSSSNLISLPHPELGLDAGKYYAVEPGKTYELSVWAKVDVTGDQSHTQLTCVFFKEGSAEATFSKSLTFADNGNTWRKYKVMFSTQGASRMYIYSRAQGTSPLTLWLDDIVITDVSHRLVNVIENDSTRLHVRSADKAMEYVEGADYEVTRIGGLNNADPLQGKTMTITRKEGGRIAQGSTLSLEYDFLPRMQEDRSETMSFADPKVIEVYRDQLIAPTLAHVHPDFVYIGMDEVRGFNRDSRSKKLGLENYELMAQFFNRVFDTIHALAPDAIVLLWDDMVSPHHTGGTQNAQVQYGGQPGKTWHALTTLKNTGMAFLDWWYSDDDRTGKIANSPSFYNQLGFAFLGGPSSSKPAIDLWSYQGYKYAALGMSEQEFYENIDGVEHAADRSWNAVKSHPTLTDPPVITQAPRKINAKEGDLVSFSITATSQNDTPTLSGSGLPPRATFTSTGGQGAFSWKTQAGDAGTRIVTIDARDAQGHYIPWDVMITVLPSDAEGDDPVIAAAVTPRPQQVQKLSGLTVDVTTDWTIAADLDDPFEAFTVQELRKELWGKGSAVPASAYPAVDVDSQPSGARIIIGNPKENADVALHASALGINIDQALQSDKYNEGYVLLVKPVSVGRPPEILILAKSTAGAYYGMVTLSWLLGLSPERGSGATLTLPHTKITDWPDMKVRAFYGGGVYSWQGETITTTTEAGTIRWLEVLTRYKYNLWMSSLPRLSLNPTAAAVQKLLDREDFLRKRHMYTVLNASPYDVNSIDRNLNEGVWMKDVPATVGADGTVNPVYTDLEMVNGGMEADADGNGVPDGWSMNNSDAETFWSVDTQDYHSAPGSAKLTLQKDLSGTTKSSAILNSLPYPQQGANGPYYKLEPQSIYELSLWAKKEGKDGVGQTQVTCVFYNDKNQYLGFVKSLIFEGNGNKWRKYATMFATLDATKMYIYSRAQGTIPVNLWLDDLSIKNVSHRVVNVLETDATRLHVWSADKSVEYAEGQDYEVVRTGALSPSDPINGKKMTITRKEGGRIAAGSTLSLEYDFLPRMQEDRYEYMSFADPKVIEVYREKVIKPTLTYVLPDFVYIGMDEVRGFNRDSRSRKLGLANYELMARFFNQIFDTIHALAPAATVLLWDDMLSPYHTGATENAQLSYGGIPGKTWHALTMLKTTGMAFLNWWYSGDDRTGKIANSPSFYNQLGISFLGGPMNGKAAIDMWSYQGYKYAALGMSEQEFFAYLDGVAYAADRAWNAVKSYPTLTDPPIVHAPRRVETREGERVAFSVTATSQTETPTLTGSDLPPGSSFTSTGNQGSFSWQTKAGDAGTYIVTVTARDTQKHYIPWDVTITVLSSDGEGEGGKGTAGGSSSDEKHGAAGGGTENGVTEGGSSGETGGGGGGGGNGGGGGGRRGTVSSLLQSFLDIGGGMVQQAAGTLQQTSSSARSFAATVRTTFTGNLPLVVRQGGFMIFLDISASSPVASDVRYLAARGVISGFRSAEGFFLRLFKPSQTLRYSEAAKIVVEAADIPLRSQDRPATLSARDHWSQAYVATLEARGSPVFSHPALDVDAPISRVALLRLILEAFDVRRDAARMTDEAVLAFANDEGWMASVPFRLTSSPQAPLRRRDVLGIVRKVMEEYGEEETVHAAAPSNSLIRRLLDRLGWERN